MGVHLIKDEKIIWKSYPGKHYRLYIFIRDFCITLLCAILLYTLLKEATLSFISMNIIRYISFGIGFIGLLLAGYHQVSFFFVRYYLTSERVLISHGFLNTNLESIKHERIQDIKIVQSFFQKMINCGDIFIFTANDSNVGANEKDPIKKIPTLKMIDNPFVIHQKLEELLEDNFKK